MENTTVRERLILFINELGISKNKFEYNVGMGKRYVSNIVNSIQPSMIEKISLVYPQLNIGWLLTGEGEMLKSANISIGIETEIGIPLIPFDAIAGFNLLDNEGVKALDCKRYHIPDFKDRGVDFLIRVSGSSMYPKFSNGDILACRIVKEILFLQWGKVYVIDTSQGVLVKRLFEDETNKDNVLCNSDNNSIYKPFIVPKSDIRSISIVIGVIRLE